jgi:hypothetical protein
MIVNSPGVVSAGLEMSVDLNNIKSYIGPAVKNFATTLSPRGQGDNGSTYRVFSGTEPVYIPEVGQVDNCAFVDSYNDFNGGSGNCCPSLYGYGDGFTVTGSTLYTYGILYRSFNRYTHPNFMYHYEFNSSGTYLTEYGVHNVGGYSGTETHLGNGWYWARAKFTSQPTAASFNTGMWMYQYATWNRIQVAKVIILQGDYMNLHPRHWPDVNTTRASTAAAYDLTGKNTVALTNASYNTDGFLNFNGSSNYYTATPAASYQLGCLDFWMYNNNAVPNNDGAIGGPSSYQSPINFNLGGTYGVNLGGWTSSATNEAFHIWSATAGGQMTYNRDYAAPGWHHVVFNWNGTNYDIWINGVKTTVYPNSAGHAKPPIITAIRVGGDVSSGYYFNGQLPVVRTYSTGLTDEQVLQNFNATRGRYGR